MYNSLKLSLKILVPSEMSLLLLPDSFRGMGAWRKTMEPKKLSNSAGTKPEVVDRQTVAKERAAQRVHSWIKNFRLCQF